MPVPRQQVVAAAGFPNAASEKPPMHCMSHEHVLRCHAAARAGRQLPVGASLIGNPTSNVSRAALHCFLQVLAANGFSSSAPLF